MGWIYILIAKKATANLGKFLWNNHDSQCHILSSRCNTNKSFGVGVTIVRTICYGTCQRHVFNFKLYVKILGPTPTDTPFPKTNKLKSSSPPALEPSSFNKTSSLDKPIRDNLLLLNYFASLGTTPLREMDADFWKPTGDNHICLGWIMTIP